MLYGSRTIAPQGKSPPDTNCNPNPKPNPSPNRGTIFLGRNCLDIVLYNVGTLQNHPPPLLNVNSTS